jgi:hypothetical protein
MVARETRYDVHQPQAYVALTLLPPSLLDEIPAHAKQVMGKTVHVLSSIMPFGQFAAKMGERLRRGMVVVPALMGLGWPALVTDRNLVFVSDSPEEETWRRLAELGIDRSDVTVGTFDMEVWEKL